MMPTQQRRIRTRHSPPPQYNDEDNEKCRACLSTALQTDWAQGDRVCTACGVVAEEQLVYDGPEWREYADNNNNNDNNAHSSARCGMIPTDETKYWGGLQPTRLAASSNKQQQAATDPYLLRRLRAVERKMNARVRKQCRKDLMAAQTAVHIRQQQQQQQQQRMGDDTTTDAEQDDNHHHVRPELEQLVWKDQAQIRRLRNALYADKWSLSRAIRLGKRQDGDDDDDDDDDDNEQLDATLRKAARDLYATWSMLEQAGRRLELPDRVVNHAATLLGRYAVHTDGVKVRGISRRSSCAREEHRIVQMGALCAGILLVTTRALQHPRSMQEICNAVVRQDCVGLQKQVDSASQSSQNPFILKKHCTRALTELRSAFPEFSQATLSRDANNTIVVPDTKSSSVEAVVQFTQHTLRLLDLPPVAYACVLPLVWQLWSEGCKKLSVVCAASTHLVCTVGSRLQRLAKHGKDRRTPARRKLSNDFKADQAEYELQRLWDTWAEQRPWERNLSDIERHCGVARSNVQPFYNEHVHKRISEILGRFQRSVSIVTADEAGDNTTVEYDGKPELKQLYAQLQETPLARLLLSKVTIAAPLLRPMNPSMG